MFRLLLALRGDRLQSEAATLAGFTQAKVSRAERGRFALSPADADTYARALGATEDQRRRLVELAETRAAEHLVSRQALVRSAPAIQERIGQLETNATLIRSWQPEIPPGILQSPGWTAAMTASDGGPDPGPQWQAARAARLARLVEPGRTWHQLVSEAALRWTLGSAAIMRGLIEHLTEVSHYPNVRLGILDLATPKPMAPPAAFHLFDDHTATVATDIGTSFVTDQHDLTHFSNAFAALDAVALHDDTARALLERIGSDYGKPK